MGSGVEFAIRSWLNNYGTLDTVGLYNAGYMIIITYGGMVFSALESDYFPRLSAITSDTAARNITINNQMEVLLLLISPMIVGLIVFMPVIVPLLLSGKFVPAITMMQIMALSLYGRSMAIPMQYLPLSRGDSYSFLFIEAVNNLLLFFATILFYDHYGLFGAGLAFTVVSIIDVIVTFLFLRMKYTYVLSSRAVKYILAQVPLGLCAMTVSFISCGWVYWIVGITLSIVSVGVSLLLIRDKSSLWDRIKSVFKVKKL
jgi:O-antigen/teichoic acid export membrane protein